VLQAHDAGLAAPLLLQMDEALRADRVQVRIGAEGGRVLATNGGVPQGRKAALRWFLFLMRLLADRVRGHALGWGTPSPALLRAWAALPAEPRAALPAAGAVRATVEAAAVLLRSGVQAAASPGAAARLAQLHSWAERSAWLAALSRDRSQGAMYVDDLRTSHGSLEDACGTADQVGGGADEASLTIRDGETKTAALLGGGPEGRARLSGDVDRGLREAGVGCPPQARRAAMHAMAARLGPLWPRMQRKAPPRVESYPYGGTVLDQDGDMRAAMEHVRARCGAALAVFIGGAQVAAAPLPLLLAQIDTKFSAGVLWGAGALLVRHPTPALREVFQGPADAGRMLDGIQQS